MAGNTQSFVKRRIGNATMPPAQEGALCTPIELDFTSTSQIIVDNTAYQIMRALSNIQGVYVDNTSGIFTVTLYNAVTNQTLYVRGGKAGYYQLLAGDEIRLVITNPNGGKLWVHFYNVPIYPWESASDLSAAEDQFIYTASAYTAYASPQDVLMVTGSPTRKVRIDGINLRINSTSAVRFAASFVKRSSLDTGGGQTAINAVKYDSSLIAPTSGVYTFSSAPVAGVSVGNLMTAEANTGAATAIAAITALAYGGAIPDPVLLNQNECVCFNMNGVSFPGLTMSFSVVVAEYD